MRRITMLVSCLAACAAMTASANASSHRHHWRAHTGYRYAVYPSHAADPAFMPNPLLDFYRRYHIRAIDEGYGRATRCN